MLIFLIFDFFGLGGRRRDFFHFFDSGDFFVFFIFVSGEGETDFFNLFFHVFLFFLKTFGPHHFWLTPLCLPFF